MVALAAPRGTRRKWQVMTLPRVLLAVVSLLSALLVSVHFAAPAAALPLSATTVITNNIQGASATAEDGRNTDSKWTTQIRNYIQAASIVLVQEAGPSGPPGAVQQADIITDGNTVRHYLWGVGTGRAPASLAQVYFLQTDDPTNPRAVGGRVNIAIVTRAVPDEVRVVPNRVNAGRAALGVRFGNNWYFSIHGLSGGGNDSSALLDDIDTAVDSWGTAAGHSYTYTIGGDFNRDPADLAAQNNNTGIPPGAHIYNSGEATHQGNGVTGGELDYFVSNDPSYPNAPVYRLDGRQGDHYAVQLGGLRAAAEPNEQPPVEPPNLKIMVTGDPVDPLNSTANGTASGISDAALLGMKEWELLATTGSFARSVDFVGDDTSSGGTPEEGTADEEISALAAQDATAIPKYEPNVVLLQAGTWDLQDGDSSGAAARVSALIDQVQAADPSAVVIVGTLGPTTNAADEALVTAYNTSLAQLVDAKVAAGQRVGLADMGALTTADLNADGVTPNAAGQQIVANSFIGAMIYAMEMNWISEPVPASAPSGSVCDIYVFYGTPCVGAYSMTRAMYSDYDGPLYQVRRASDGTTADIGLLAAGGDVDASQQASFCAGTTCTVTILYDQSPQENDLTTAPGGGAAHAADNGADAAALPITIGGNKAYGLDVEPGTGYRNNYATGTATAGQPEGMYMVASGTHVNNGCCFDFGNAEINSQDNGNGHMDAVNFGTNCFYSPCTGSGPWVAADMENGLFQGGNGSNTANKGNSSDFVTALLKNDGQTTYALKGGDAQSGGLSTWWNGSLPTNVSGYTPMNQEGAIILGTGGDNSNWDVGSFFEGVMTAGYPSDTADAAVQANIVAAGYSGNSSPASAAAPSAAGQAVVHDGYSSVYTVDSANGHLQESYLPAMGDSWSTQDLSANYHTPVVMAGTEPVAVYHCGYTSVYTVDAASGDLQETYLPGAASTGIAWQTQDLSANYGTPPTDTTPTAVVHSAGAGAGSAGCDGYTSVYTVNRNGDLQETYLPNQGFPGDGWVSQDLSANYHTPGVLPGTAPVAIVHCGYTSVYTVDGSNKHLQETYLPAIGDPWVSQDLSANYGTPPTDTTPTAVVHSAGAGAGSSGCDAYTSVYTVNQAGRDLQETYLPNQGFPGDKWVSQDLSANYHTPPVAPGTQPEALVHMGYTSVYTTDQGTGQVQETYLPAIGDPWVSQSLTANYGTPVTDQSPIVLLHQDTSGNLDWASVFTIGEFTAQLQETYLPNAGFPGDSWVTQNLFAKYNVPPVYVQQGAAAGWSVVHDGYTSAYTVDASNGHLDESYLPAMGQQWVWQDLSANYQAPAVKAGTVPVALYHDGYTSVYTVDAASRDLQETYLPGAASTGVGWKTQDLSATFGATTVWQVAAGSSPAAVFHDGYASVFTVDAVSGALRETYLPAAGFPGDPWQTQSLTAKYNTPAVMTGTSPVAVVHDGYVSVYTIDAGDSTHVQGDLQETYLPFMGAGWSTQDLSAEFGTPPSHVTPAAVFHNGYVSVYTVGSQGDLQETFLPAMGDGWLTQDLTANSGVPKALNVAPTALYHDGYTSVYYLSNPGDHLTEAYLPAISGPWHWQDLSANTSVPASVQSPSALVHYDTSGGLTYASVYTTDASTGDLRETYLPDAGFPGDAWVTQDLSAKYHTPAGEQGGGSVMYAPSSGSESLGYARMIRLAYAGSANGTLLATFEHSAGGGAITDYEIRKSTDDGATWSTLSTVPGDIGSLAPFLFEYPQQLGSYPAGTLMLLGNTVNGSNTGATIREWLSIDHGAHWTYVGVVQSSSGGPGDGVWEPFVMVDKSGDLAMFFSDERQHATYSQFLGEIISGDGGNTWSANAGGSASAGPGEIKVVASSFPADRPGMATVAPIGLGYGGYALSYEMCGPQACSVHVKISPDGTTWASDPAGTPSGPVTLGTVAETSDGLFLQGTPVITSVNNGGPVSSTLYLSGRYEASVSGTVPPHQNIILTNRNGGTGPWSWIPAPAIPTAGAPSACNTNYSPELLRSPDNSQLLYTVAAAAGPYNCEEITARVTIQS